MRFYFFEELTLCRAGGGGDLITFQLNPSKCLEMCCQLAHCLPLVNLNSQRHNLL